MKGELHPTGIYYEPPVRYLARGDEEEGDRLVGFLDAVATTDRRTDLAIGQ